MLRHARCLGFALAVCALAHSGLAEPVSLSCAREGRQVQRQPACARGKSVYLVAWCDGNRQIEKPTADIYCARVDPASGKSLDPAGIRVCSAADLQEWPAIAFDGVNFLIVWQDLRSGKDYDLYAARVAEDGKVLDPDGFAVIRRESNQARPCVAFADGKYIVAWMDARHYPTYGLYAARVTPDGKVLDPDGKVLDAEDPAKVQKARPATQSWLGDKHYWWSGLASRYHPSIASNGKTCLVTYLRDVHSNQNAGWSLLLNPADCSVAGAPARLSGEPRNRIAACALPEGWVIAQDHWIAGWSPTARLAGARLEASGKPRDTLPQIREGSGKLPESGLVLDLQKALAGGGGEYQQGKGHTAFWQTAVAYRGTAAAPATRAAPLALVASDYGWRTKSRPSELNYAIVVSGFDCQAGRFVDDPPSVLATGSSTADTCVRNPVMAAGPEGEALVTYENDAGLGRLTVESRLIRP